MHVSVLHAYISVKAVSPARHVWQCCASRGSFRSIVLDAADPSPRAGRTRRTRDGLVSCEIICEVCSGCLRLLRAAQGFGQRR